MLKPKVVVDAWISVFKGVTTKEHKRRASICNDCNNNKYNKYLDFVNDELKEVKGLVCTDCGCPLIAKIRSKEVCKYWK